MTTLVGDGIAKIKPEFIIQTPAIGNNGNLKDEECVPTEPEAKRIKAEEPEVTEKSAEGADKPAGEDGKRERKDKNKNKVRGQNKPKDRPWYHPTQEARLCQAYLDGEPSAPCSYPNCKSIHNVQVYLDSLAKTGIENKPCVVFETYGKCPRGLSCVFAKSHMDMSSGSPRNAVNTELWAEKSKEYDKGHGFILGRDLQHKLRARKVDFSEINKVVNSLGKNGERKTVGGVTDEDIIRTRQEEIKKIDWNDKLYLSPLTTVGNLPFRRLCVKFGADVTCSEMSLASSLVQGQAHEYALHRRHESEKLWGVQLCATNPRIAAFAAKSLQEAGVDYDFVDLNMGCPLDNIVNMGGGSGLFYRQGTFKSIVSAMTGSLKKPFTVKTRTGIKTGVHTTHEFLPFLRDSGVSMVILHGRSREQRYAKVANWDYIKECAEVAAPMPLFGNGDVFSWEDYQARKQGVTGVVIGRGAIIKPWIFQEIKEQRYIDLNASQRLEILQTYANYGLDHWGTDLQGVETTRRFLLEFISFFRRYIPHGIMESPWHMNQRPPSWKGRDEMETLLGSNNSNDWIKISEMFLGKVPDNFAFLPKHKANAW